MIPIKDNYTNMFWKKKNLEQFYVLFTKRGILKSIQDVNTKHSNSVIKLQWSVIVASHETK